MFEIKLESQTINLKWGTWAMARACKLAGVLTVNDYFSYIQEDELDISKMLQKHLIMVRAGIEYANEGVCDYTDIGLSGIIDELGGIVNNKTLTDYYGYIEGTMRTNITPLPNSKPAKKKPAK